MVYLKNNMMIMVKVYIGLVVKLDFNDFKVMVVKKELVKYISFGSS